MRSSWIEPNTERQSGKYVMNIFQSINSLLGETKPKLNQKKVLMAGHSHWWKNLIKTVMEEKGCKKESAFYDTCYYFTQNTIANGAPVTISKITESGPTCKSTCACLADDRRQSTSCLQNDARKSKHLDLIPNEETLKKYEIVKPKLYVEPDPTAGSF